MSNNTAATSGGQLSTTNIVTTDLKTVPASATRLTGDYSRLVVDAVGTVT